MSTQQTNTNKQISDYQALSPTQKTMVRIMAVNVGYCRLHAMISCLSDLGRVNEKTGKAFTAASIQHLQKELIEKELLLKSSKGICCQSPRCSVSPRYRLSRWHAMGLPGYQTIFVTPFHIGEITRRSCQ